MGHRATAVGPKVGRAAVPLSVGWSDGSPIQHNVAGADAYTSVPSGIYTDRATIG